MVCSLCSLCWNFFHPYWEIQREAFPPYPKAWTFLNFEEKCIFFLAWEENLILSMALTDNQFVQFPMLLNQTFWFLRYDSCWKWTLQRLENSFLGWMLILLRHQIDWVRLRAISTHVLVRQVFWYYISSIRAFSKIGTADHVRPVNTKI